MAPWCGHCKKLAPTYEQVAKDLIGTVSVAKVDGTKAQGLAARFPMQVLPMTHIGHQEPIAARFPKARPFVLRS